MKDASYFGKVVEAGHVYELGYRRCACHMVLAAQVKDPGHCECTRQSILYILSQLMPGSQFDVDILETVLCGSELCRFQITRKE